MRNEITLTFLLFALLVLISGCMKRGPYVLDTQQPLDLVIQVDFVDARNEDELYDSVTYTQFVICTLDSKQTLAFLEEIQTLDFFIPGYEPSRHLGEIAARLYYSDGSSEFIGNNCSKYFDADFICLDRGIYYPDEESFYELFSKYADSQSLPRRN